MDTIESIRQQTYPHWELLIIDDGSDDDTEERVLSLTDPRINFYKAGRIGVLGKLKNIGLEKANGELIAFMDSDDLWAADKLEKQVKAMKKYNDAGFSMTGGYSFNTPGEPVQYYYEQKSGELYGNLLEPCFRSSVAALTPTLLFKKECLAVGRFEEGRLFSDIAFILRLAEHYNGVVLYEPLLYRRLHPENTTNAHWELGYTEYIELIGEYREKRKLANGLARQSLFKLYINYGEKCLRYRQKGKAVRVFLKAWMCRPLSVVPIKKIGKVMVR